MTPFWNDDVAQWIAAKLDEKSFGNCHAMGVLHDGELVAGVVYHQYSPEAGVIQMSAAAITAKWMTRPVLWEMFDYPFNRAKCQLCVLRVSETNHTEGGRGLVRLLPAYGFKSYLIPRLRGRNEAEIIFTLSDDDWRANGFHRQNES